MFNIFSKQEYSVAHVLRFRTKCYQHRHVSMKRLLKLSILLKRESRNVCHRPTQATRFQRGRSPVERVQLRAEQLRLFLRARLEALGEPSRAGTWCVNIFRSTIRRFRVQKLGNFSSKFLKISGLFFSIVNGIHWSFPNCSFKASRQKEKYVVPRVPKDVL